MMTFENPGVRSLDYQPCNYGDDRLSFRGPKRDLGGDYVAFLGGTETYGKFIARPYPAIVEAETGLTCVNLGLNAAGLDVYLNASSVLAAAARARICVVQLMGAHNLSNRFYAVHPRRNDRFIRASQLMQTIFREVDFTEFHFTRHMLGQLATVAPERFRLIVDEIQQAWVARMGTLLNRLETDVVLLWFAAHAPEDRFDPTGAEQDPFGIERWMIERLRPRAARVVEVVASPAALARGTEGMIYADMDEPVARGMMGPAAHDEAAGAVVDALAGLLK
ncbi:DUF6473 family protein [Aquicoccus porphyridii]|uniref:DUF6473 family protein n=1 Tax=Aquicoccus porphyridii TaxID=1852029 RepID=UPI003517023C